jgi:hypothetical protein
LGYRIDTWIESAKTDHKREARNRFVVVIGDIAFVALILTIVAGWIAFLAFFPWVFFGMVLLGLVIWGGYKLIWLFRP